MTSRRGVLMPIRTPLLFLGWFVVLIALGVAPTAIQGVLGPDASLHDTYYVVAHWHYLLSLAVAPLVFAAVYEGLGRFFRAPCREALGQLHFWLFAIGCLLILAPTLLLPFATPRRYVDYPQSFAFWSFVSYAGYAMTLVGLAVFLIAIIEALLRRFTAGKAD